MLRLLALDEAAREACSDVFAPAKVAGMKRLLLPTLLLSALVLGALVLTGCGESSSDTPPDSVPSSKGQVQTYGESDTAISVPVGGTFKIMLPINPSTGYSWSSAIDGANIVITEATIMEPPMTEDEADGTDAMQVGVPTSQLWTLRADKAGTTKLRFELLPPGQTKPEKTIEYTVTSVK